jgi:hypothetical protein
MSVVAYKEAYELNGPEDEDKFILYINNMHY